MTRIALACLLSLVTLPAWSTDLTVACTPSLTKTDDSVIPAGTPMTFTLYGSMAGQPLAAIPDATGLTICSSVRKNVNTGVLQYAYTETIPGFPESAQSAVTSYTVAAPSVAPSAPGAPTVSVVTTSTIAYMLIPGADTYAPLIVGSVPLGTPCDTTKPILKYFVIPRASVTFTGTIKPPAVIGYCGA